MAQQPMGTKDIQNDKFNEEEQPKDKPNRLIVYLAGITANLSSVACGTAMGWTSPVLPCLKSNKTCEHPLSEALTMTDESWILGSMSSGAILTPFLGGYLADIIGRKIVLLASAVLFITAYSMMLFASKVRYIIVARLVKGFGVGFANAIVPMYVGEIAADDIRGALGSLLNSFLTLGIFLVTFSSSFFSHFGIQPYYGIQYFCIANAVLFLVTFSFMPESPYFYVMKKKRQKALNALKFLRRQSEEALQPELNAIEKLVSQCSSEKCALKALFGHRANRKAVIICFGVVSFEVLAGFDPITFNVQSICEKAETGISGHSAANIINVVQVITAGIYPFCADKLGRRTYLLISSFFSGFSLILLAFFFYMKLSLGIESGIQWIPIPSLIIYVIMLVIGLGPLPWMLVGEMFAPNVKQLAASMFASLSWLLGFLEVYWYPALETAGLHYAFWMYGFSCLPFAFLFCWYLVLETRGLSLQEIQNRLNK